MNILVTGGNGFVGQAVCAYLAMQRHYIKALARDIKMLSFNENTSQFIIKLKIDFNKPFFLQQYLGGVDIVVHCAACVHQVHETTFDSLATYRLVNATATIDLAQAASAAGIRRFVFISSIKVNGELTSKDRSFHADDINVPTDPYALSKYEAEIGLRRIAAETGMEVVIVRPPLVYGPGVKANFLTMMQWLQRGIPLPLGAIHNQRSLVGLGNLVDLLEKCLTHPAAANQTFLASDGQDVSTTELLRALAKALGVPARLLPVPQAWLEGALDAVGREALAQRLCGNLAVDIKKTRQLLDWTPPYTLAQGLQATADHFLAQR